MSQGIFASLEQLTSMIQSLTPKTDTHHGFVNHDPASGLVPPLELRPHSTRYFDYDLETLAEDDGQAGLSGRKRCSINLRVRYDIPQERGFLMRLINEDAALLIDKLKGPYYNLSTSGIVSLIPGQPRIEGIPDEAGNIIALFLILPFDLLYLEVA